MKQLFDQVSFQTSKLVTEKYSTSFSMARFFWRSSKIIIIGHFFKKLGFNVGLIADLRLHKNLNLRFEPGLMSNSKTIYYNNSPALLSSRDSVREIGTTYLHLPLVLKLSTDRWNNVRPYVLAGISYDHNFSSNQDNSNDNYSGEFRMKTSNFMYEVGIGIDIYLYFFKFSPSIRGVFAMNRELVDDNNMDSPWTSPIDVFSTRGVFLSLAFE